MTIVRSRAGLQKHRWQSVLTKLTSTAERRKQNAGGTNPVCSDNYSAKQQPIEGGILKCVRPNLHDQPSIKIDMGQNKPWQSGGPSVRTILQ